MVNLEQLPICDRIINDELKEAGISAVRIGKLNNSVPASIIGKCNNFIFIRDCNYWIVDGLMPLEIAEKYNNENIEKQIVKKTEDEYIAAKFDFKFPLFLNKQCLEKALDNKKGKTKLVERIYIDTQEKLNGFINTIKENKILAL